MLLITYRTSTGMHFFIINTSDKGHQSKLSSNHNVDYALQIKRLGNYLIHRHKGNEILLIKVFTSNEFTSNELTSNESTSNEVLLCYASRQQTKIHIF